MSEKYMKRCRIFFIFTAACSIDWHHSHLFQETGSVKKKIDLLYMSKGKFDSRQVSSVLIQNCARDPASNKKQNKTKKKQKKNKQTKNKNEQTNNNN